MHEGVASETSLSQQAGGMRCLAALSKSAQGGAANLIANLNVPRTGQQLPAVVFASAVFALPFAIPRTSAARALAAPKNRAAFI
jgi:hypothetical protein